SAEEHLDLDDAGWQTLWTKASGAAKPKLARLPNYRPLQKVRKLRNAVVHHGVVPDPGDVSAAVPAVEAMHSACFASLYDADFGTYRLIDEIAHDGVRKLLGEAEEAIAMGEPTWSLAA